MADVPEQSIKFPARAKSELSLALPRRQGGTRAPEIAAASAEARKSINAIISVTRTPWGEARLLDSAQVGELEKSLRELEQKLVGREREIAELEVALASRERDMAESEALLLAREKLVDIARKNSHTPGSRAATKEEQVALEHLRAELLRQENTLKEAKKSQREREQFLDESESKLFEKVQAQQEKETELDQREEELRAREKRLREREAAVDPQVAAAMKSEAAAAKRNFNEFKE
ncbi:MAG: hypothetical protein ABSE59_06535 [Opitutaceae bacterium]|jgi:uncharacterized protein YlxW (UPF0749 family)